MIQRFIILMGTLWLTASLSFFALRLLPGDAITNQLLDSGASPSTIANRQAMLGLDQPLLNQYIHWLEGITQGNLGVSITDGRSVREIILQQLPETLELAIAAMLIAIITGITLGCAAGFDHKPSQVILSSALSTPIYWSGTVALWITTAILNWIPGTYPPDSSSLLLPAAILGFHTAGGIGRSVGASVKDVRHADFIITAHSKGLSKQLIQRRHILRASLLPAVNVIALQTGFLISGTIITETVFNRPGIGRILLDAVMRQDYPVVQGIAVWTAFAYTLINFAADVIQHLIDPRVTA